MYLCSSKPEVNLFVHFFTSLRRVMVKIADWGEFTYTASRQVRCLLAASSEEPSKPGGRASASAPAVGPRHPPSVSLPLPSLLHALGPRHPPSPPSLRGPAAALASPRREQGPCVLKTLTLGLLTQWALHQLALTPLPHEHHHLKASLQSSLIFSLPTHPGTRTSDDTLSFLFCSPCHQTQSLASHPKFHLDSEQRR